MSESTATTVALRGLSTVTLWADDVSAATDWYTGVLGTEPYFVRPEAPESPLYVEFRLGDNHDELGILDRRFAPARASAEIGGAVVYWHADDARATYQRLLDAGASSYEPPVEREAGFVTASVVDPFGNVLGVMYNPNWVENS
ncbi:MAG: VOC family protein, partial [Glaciihabitans sp.]